jgi:hypothetical protein
MPDALSRQWVAARTSSDGRTRATTRRIRENAIVIATRADVRNACAEFTGRPFSRKAR